MKKPTTHRAGFGPHCRLEAVGIQGERRYAQWKGIWALNRDGTRRVFATPDAARAWLAAADVTKGASARHD